MHMTIPSHPPIGIVTPYVGGLVPYDAGKGTIKAPFPNNPELRLWTGRLPKSELNELILAINIKLFPQGYLSKDSIDIATKLPIPFASMQTIDDERRTSSRPKSGQCVIHIR